MSIEIISIISKVCSLFLMIGVGAAAVKCGVIPKDSTSVLSKVLFNIVTPAAVLITMQGQAFTGQTAEDALWAILSFTLVTLTVGLLSFGAAGLFRVPERDRGVYRIQLAFTNVGFMGIPLVTVVFGEAAGLPILLMNTVYLILIYSFGVFLLLHERGRKLLDPALLKRMVNIPLVSSCGGIVLLVTGLRLPEAVNSGLALLGDAMVPLGMLIVGIQLSKTRPARVLTRRNLGFCLLSLLAVPALAMVLCIFLPQSSLVSAVLVYAMAMPSGTMCAVLAEEFDRGPLLASEALALNTLLSLVTLPAWALILTHVYMR